MPRSPHRVGFAATSLLFLAGSLVAVRVQRALGCSYVQSLAWVLLGIAVLWGLGRLLGLDRRGRVLRRLRGMGLEDLDRLEGAAFEDWVAAVLAHQGFEIQPTGRTRDFGVDLIARRNHAVIGVEAKRYGKPVSNHAIRSTIAGCQFHGCTHGAVITQSRFTTSAERQAARSPLPLRLIDRNGLEHLGRVMRDLAAEDPGGGT